MILWQEISLNPFKNSKKINYSLNDISNYPIGIFKIDRKYIDYSVSFNASLIKLLSVKKY